MKLTAGRPEDTLTGDELAILRQGAKVTQAQLADLLGIWPNSLCRAEHEDPPLSVTTKRLVVYALAEHLRTTPRAIRERIVERRERWRQVHVNYDALRAASRAASEARLAEIGGRRTRRPARKAGKHR